MAATVVLTTNTILVVLIFAGLSFSDTLHLSAKINITNVFYQYTQLCGPKLCNTSSTFMSSVDGVDDCWSPCPDCFCDRKWYSRGDCCPDKLPTTCVNKVLVIGTNEKHVRNHNYMVSGCPENTDSDLRSKCEEKITKENYLQKYPVTGTGKSNSDITYKNRYCAICNGVRDYSTWELNITCPVKRFSIAQYSSAEEIWDAVENQDCTMKYDPVHTNDNMTSCESDSEELVNQCNVTGKWNKYDRDIEWACGKYSHKFGVFRNVFCYLCNMGDTNLSYPSKECNNTGLWTEYSTNLSEACVTKMTEPWFLPFPNRYCFLCNTNNKTTSGVLTDANIDLKESYHSLEQFPFFTNITISFLKEHNKIEYYENEALNTTHSSHTNFEINITRLYTAYREAGGKSGWCSKEFKSDGKTECLCDQSCYFNGQCCPDFVLNDLGLGNLYSLIISGGNNNNDNHHKYLLIGACPDTYQNKTIRRKCETPTADDIMTLIPVNDDNRISYRNKYCYLCNSGKHEGITFWKIHLKCPMYVSFQYFTSLKTILSFADKAGCIGRTVQPEKEIKIERLAAKCNVTGNWSSYDRNIEYACENDLVNSAIGFASHKKNVFCAICNENKLEEEERFSVTEQAPKAPQGEIIFVKPFRTLFSIKDLIDDKEITDRNRRLIQGSCVTNHVYDVYKLRCRKIICAPGKQYKNGRCVPLFDDVYELRYQIPIRIESEYLTNLQISKIVKTLYSIQTILSKITDNPSLYINTSTTSLDWYYAYFYWPCPTSGKRPTIGTFYATQTETQNNTDVLKLKVLINFSMRIKTPELAVSRVRIEEQLLNFTDNPLVLQVGDEYLNLSLQLDKKAFDLKSTIYISESKKHCKILSENFSEYSNSISSLKPLLVNKLLFCAQIELALDEFAFISDESIRIKALNSILDFDKYQICPNGEIRMCIDDYVALQEVMSSSKYDLPLEIFTFICICLSLICLFLTLIAHIIFPVLQSLAGKNIICLAISLILSQLSFLISNFSNGTIFCQIIGALTHYFWMSYFCCMNVCSFHMYHVFTSRSTMESTRYKDRRMLLRYCIYSFGVPLVIVLINVAVGLILNDGYRTLYGRKNCFHSEMLPLVCSFIVPVLILCIINIIFFLMAACRITFTKNDTSTGCSSGSQYKISIYVKLFILTGFTWIFQIVDAFVEPSLFSFIATALNGCQGVYIFVSYVCTKRVFKHIKTNGNKQTGSNWISDAPTKSRISRSQTITDSPRSTKITTANNNDT